MLPQGVAKTVPPPSLTWQIRYVTFRCETACVLSSVLTRLTSRLHGSEATCLTCRQYVVKYRVWPCVFSDGGLCPPQRVELKRLEHERQRAIQRKMFEDHMKVLEHQQAQELLSIPYESTLSGQGQHIALSAPTTPPGTNKKLGDVRAMSTQGASILFSTSFQPSLPLTYDRQTQVRYVRADRQSVARSPYWRGHQWK